MPGPSIPWRATVHGVVFDFLGATPASALRLACRVGARGRLPPGQVVLSAAAWPPSLASLFASGNGERAGARTQDPVIKSHVLYRLSYALT